MTEIKRQILSNKIKCNYCGDVIESKTVHDFEWCTCGKVCVDGGLEYCRRGFTLTPNDFTDLSEYEDVVNETE